ncbi:MAG: translation initiation factor IF-3 [Verrucomicrobia bacterium GWC2_42_7]|nr:MAG: translation initiation factor IF-3 [Verrucomicrobia bacterium GWC2_42_7]
MSTNPSYPRNKFQRGNFHSRYNSGPRKNDKIRANEVRVIGPDGQQIGVMLTRDAVQRAKMHGLDLVEISPNAQPPVCKIVDFGKYMYEEGKKTKGSKSQVVKVKEIKFRVGIEQNDFFIKLRHAEDFLNDGNKVKFTLAFRGREAARQELGFTVINRAITELVDIGVIDSKPVLAGRNITVSLSPLPANKRKLKFNHIVGEASPDEEE